MTVLLLLLRVSFGFGGVLVGGEGDTLVSKHSQVVVVREGYETTLTIVPGYYGDAARVALVVPVPEPLTAADVSTPDPTLLDRLDVNAAPRLVHHECGDFFYDGGGAAPLERGCNCGQAPSQVGNVLLDVPLEPETTASVRFPYSATSATWTTYALTEQESADVPGYLVGLGFDLDDDTYALMESLHEDEPGYVVATLDLGLVPEGQVLLPPVQIRFEAFSFDLPARVSAANAEGTQEVLVYGIGTFEDGRLGIGDLPHEQLTAECLLRDDVVLDDWYPQQLDAVLGAGPAWITEFAFGRGECRCEEDEYLSDADLAALGFTGSAGDAFVTRLRARYLPGELDDDPVLYWTGITDFETTRWIEYAEGLEEFFEICGEETPSDAPQCTDLGTSNVASRLADQGSQVRASIGYGASLFLASGLVGWRRRRPTWVTRT